MTTLKDSIILPINEELSSTIHPNHDEYHIKQSNLILYKIISKLKQQDKLLNE